jgi:hypothetical protein
MKALERYVKKNGKAHPFGSTKPKGSWKGSEGPQKKDQYAKESGKKVVEDEKDYDETDPKSAGMAAYQSVRGFGKKKNKQRSYLDD